MANYNLLKELDQEDYRSLIQQVEFAEKGYNIQFIIDSDLIGNYCYPFGLNPETKYGARAEKIKDIEYLSDEQITLHSLFYLSSNKILLLDQYFDELEGMLYKATKIGKQKIKSIDLNFGVFKFSKNSELLEILYDSFANMFTKALLHIDGLKKVSNLLNGKKVLLDADNLTNSVNKEVVTACQPQIDKVDNIKSVMRRFIGKNNELFFSRNRDAEILSRILCFNEIAKTKKLRNIYILLSDTEILKNTLKTIKDGESILQYPIIDRQKIDFYRNVSQSFAYTICLSYNGNKIDYKKTIYNLKTLQETSRIVNEKLNSTAKILESNSFELTSNKIYDNYHRLRNEYENSGLLKSFNPLFNSIKADLKGKEITDVVKIFDDFQKEGQRHITNISNTNIALLRKLKNLAHFNTSFIYGIDRIKESNDTFDISKGSDYIEGTFHHLPIYLTFKKSSNKYEKHFLKLVEIIFSRNLSRSRDIIIELNELISIMNSSKFNDLEKSEINLIKAFIFMILPSQNKKNGIKENDILAASWLSDLIINEDNEELFADKLYLQIWAERRIKNFSKSVNHAKKAIKLFPEDPRFYHGLFLSQYCMSEDRQNSDNKLLNDLLKNLDKADELYIEFALKNYEKTSYLIDAFDSFDQSYINSKCYCRALIAYNLLKNDKNTFIEMLKDIREDFDELKDEEGKFFFELTEYYDTEAFIEYLESYYVDNKSEKLDYAEKAITKAIKQTTNDNLKIKYIKKLKVIEERIEKIKSR